MQSYLSRLNIALGSTSGRQLVVVQGGILRNTVEGLLGQGKLLLGSSGFSTLSDVHLFARAGTVLALRSDPHIVNIQRRNISVVGALSRTFSVPSVSGTSFQVCEYHIDRLVPNSTQLSPARLFAKTQMAASGSSALLRDNRLDNLTVKNGHVADYSSRTAVSYKSRRTDSCMKATMSLKNRFPSHNNHTYGFIFFNVVRSCGIPNPFNGPETRDVRGSFTACSFIGAAPEVSLDASVPEKQRAASEVTSDQKTSGQRTLKLLSGSCCLPHPDKEKTGGEDAHFICTDEQAIGVADGVGGWAELGIDAGLYARELMSNSVAAIQEEPKGSIDPVRVLEKAHSSTKAQGSSTACIIALKEQGLHAINLGDSGFVVIRDGSTVFRSPVQQYEFNFPYQLGSGNDGDLPSSGQVFTVPVAPGDVIVAGTDGLFDNLYNNEVTAVVVHAVRAGLGPQVMAKKIADLARQRAEDKHRQTPFSSAAQDAGFRYYGGKLDDITVVVSYIASSSSNSSSKL